MELKKEVILVEPFGVSEDLRRQGYDGKVIADRLIDQLTYIARISRIKPDECLNFVQSSRHKQIKLEVLGTGITLSTLTQTLRELIGTEVPSVSGDLISLGTQRRKLELRVRVHLKLASVKTISGDLSDFDTLLIDAAKYVYLNTSGDILVGYQFNTDASSEKKGCLDTIKYMILNESRDDDSIAYELWGLILVFQERHEEAVEKFEMSIEIDPTNVNAYLALGLALTRIGKYEEAISKYEESIEIDPDNPFSYIHWGITLSIQKEYKKAAEKYKKSLKIDPNTSAAYNNLGKNLNDQKKYELSIDYFKRAVAIEPRDQFAYVGYRSEKLGEV